MKQSTYIKWMFSIFAFFLTINLVKAQVPQSFSYQAMARNASGVLSNQSIGVRFSITDNNTIVYYSERQAVTTNSTGLFTCNVGTGTVLSGGFALIDWSTGNKYLKVEMDASGGTTYTSLGATQLLSVPYSFYASRAGSGTLGIKTISTGYAATAMGDSTVASGDFSTVIGYQDTASGPYSFAGGQGSSATQNFGFAFGFNNKSTNNFSTAIGLSNLSSGSISFASGNTSIASGNVSTAFGETDTASGESSFVTGGQKQCEWTIDVCNGLFGKI